MPKSSLFTPVQRPVAGLTAICVALAVMIPAARAVSPIAGRTTARVSLSASGVEGAGLSRNPKVSSDGRLLAFASDAQNLIPGDGNALCDVFVRDLATGVTERVDVSSAGLETNGRSVDPSMSADGRFVAFWSEASNLVEGDTNGRNDVFVHDRASGATIRVSVGSGGDQGDGPSTDPVMSANGRFIAFVSRAGNLVPDDTNGSADVFVHDRALHTTARVSVATSGAEGDGDSADIEGNNEALVALSADGRFVAFESYAGNLVADDTNGVADVFVRDRAAGTTTRISVATDGAEGDLASGILGVAISQDGRYVAFASDATTLVPGDTNGATDIFVRDLALGTTTRVSASPSGGQTDGPSRFPTFSADARFIAFTSGATNLALSDVNGQEDIFVLDQQTGALSMASMSTDEAQLNGPSDHAALSADGGTVFFDSAATNAVSVDTNERYDVFVRSSDSVLLAAVSPNRGSENGHERIRLTGGGFTDAATTAVEIGGVSAAVVSVNADTIVAITPAGTGVEDVVVSTPAGSAALHGAYTFIDPLLAARLGNVNTGRGDPEDVVTVNGGAGDANRELALGFGERITVRFASPSSLGSARFALYAWLGASDASHLAPQPLDLGTMTFPTPLSGGSPQPKAIWNNLGHDGALGAARYPSSPAPSTVFDRARGFSEPFTVTFQGFIRDGASATGRGGSITNAVVLRVE